MADTDNDLAAEPDNDADDGYTPPAQTTTVTINLGTPLAAAADLARSRIAAAEDGKAAKADVHYREAFGSDRCGTCGNRQFEPGATEGTCSVVAGVIRTSMLCDRFTVMPPALERQPENT